VGAGTLGGSPATPPAEGAPAGGVAGEPPSVPAPTGAGELALTPPEEVVGCAELPCVPEPVELPVPPICAAEAAPGVPAG